MVPADQIQTNAVITGGVNFRTGPSGTADVISTLPAGLDVEIVQETSNWVQIRFVNQDGSATGQEGWVFNSFVESALLAQTEAVASIASAAEEQESIASNTPVAGEQDAVPSIAPAAGEQ